ncbi:MAG: glycosyltransferase, partial [Muribaculaceae bacterium]|nr:glycosyltransferase [Muribaculaceae bacterium]
RSRIDTFLNTKVEIIVTIHGLRALEINRDRYEAIYSNSIKDTIKYWIKQSPYFKILHKKYKRKYQKILNSNNVKIITVSNHSKYSIKYFYPNFNIKEISVKYSPNTSKDIISNKLNENKSERYYLIVSADRWLKNAYRAIKTFEYLFDNFLIDPNVKIFITGLKKDSKIWKKIKNKENYKLFGYLEREELENLYANAYALVYPTLNEGFGYPPLEAMKYGTPVLASAVTSIPEICGDSVLYFNPYQEFEIANRILQIEDVNIRNQFSVKALQRFNIIKNQQDKDLQSLAEEIIS